MTVNFPEKSDIPLRNAPLVEVICQVRIPPILRISKEPPIDFQEEIRYVFPNLDVEQGFLFRVPKLGIDKEPEIKTDNLVYRFKSMNAKTSASLAVDFYAVSTQDYAHWQEFLHYLIIVNNAVQKIYKPTFANRIGLRFVNRLTPENTGLLTLTEICDLLHPDLTVFLRSDGWASSQEMETRILLLDEKRKLNLRAGYGKQANNPYFLLDFDCFEEDQLAITSLLERIDIYHNVIYRAFRWCIPDEKLIVFDPIIEETK